MKSARTSTLSASSVDSSAWYSPEAGAVPKLASTTVALPMTSHSEKSLASKPSS